MAPYNGSGDDKSVATTASSSIGHEDDEVVRIRRRTSHDARAGQQQRILQAELHQLQAYLGIVQTHHARLVQQRQVEKEVWGSAAPTQTDLTKAEHKILNKYTYHNWTAGTLAGLACYGILHGSSVLLAKRRGRVRTTMPPPMSRAAATLPSSFRRQHVDGGTASAIKSQVTTNMVSSKSSWPTAAVAANTTHHETNAGTGAGTGARDLLDDETARSLQIMIFGMLSLLVTNATATAYAHQEQYFANLSTLPLQPGRSYLCRDLCPALLQQQHELYQQLYDIDTTNSPPLLPELAHMQRLLHTCQQRLTFETQQQQSSSSLPAAVPAPGLPAHAPIDDTLVAHWVHEYSNSSAQHHRATPSSVSKKEAARRPLRRKWRQSSEDDA